MFFFASSEALKKLPRNKVATESWKKCLTCYSDTVFLEQSMENVHFLELGIPYFHNFVVFKSSTSCMISFLVLKRPYVKIEFDLQKNLMLALCFFFLVFY